MVEEAKKEIKKDIEKDIELDNNKKIKEYFINRLFIHK